MSEYIIRNAKPEDAAFLADTVISAEKSGSEKLSYCTLFNLTAAQAKHNITCMFEEEIDGCEFSISSFLVVEFEGKPVAAFGGWIETMNEDETPSKLLKSNLISYTFGREALEFLKTKAAVINALVTERNPMALQLEYLYVDAGHRGKNLSALLIETLEKRALAAYPGLKKVQVQVYSNNIPAINIYKKAGFEIVSTSKSNHPEVLEFLPWNEKHVMQKTIN